MNPHDDTAGSGALTPEERALAQRLARLSGAQAEPSPALDARILAAAHAAAETPAEDDGVPPTRRFSYRRATRKPVRWPVVFGFAASLALAFGIAWELRPVPPSPSAERAQAFGEEPLAAYKPPPPTMSARAIPSKPLAVPAPPPAEQPRAPVRRTQTIRETTPADTERKPPVFDDIHFVDEAVPEPAQIPSRERQPPPAPPAEAAAAAPMPQHSAPSVAAKAANMAQRDADAALRQREAARDTQDFTVDEPEFAEADEEVVPPATADSPEVRDAWLERIRELLRDGDLDAARESLRAFRARYPHHRLPDDLRALEE